MRQRPGFASVTLLALVACSPDANTPQQRTDTSSPTSGGDTRDDGDTGGSGSTTFPGSTTGNPGTGDATDTTTLGDGAPSSGDTDDSNPQPSGMSSDDTAAPDNTAVSDDTMSTNDMTDADDTAVSDDTATTDEIATTDDTAVSDSDDTTDSSNAGDTSDDTTFAPDDRSAAAVCARWNADRADMSEGTWSGSVEACEPGTISAEGHANALRLYNLYRWLADLPPVVADPELDRLAQACSLLMEANGNLSHNPPMSWTCWTQDGADGAGGSNISTGSSVRSVDGYMIDPGNETTIGHRRWILSNSLGPIGIGSTGDGASCMHNLRGRGDAQKPWMAWPPPGAFPLQATSLGRRTTLDETGWTVQSDDIDLGNASVTVTSDGMNLPVTVTQLDPNYGSRDAFRFNPDGWETEAGRTYAISVGGVATPIEYEVSVVDCAQ